MSRSSNPSPEVLRRIEAREALRLRAERNRPAETFVEGFARAAAERDYADSLGSGVAAELRASRERQ